MYPKLFEFGPITLHTYGLLLATAFLAATVLTARLARKDDIPSARVWDLGFIIILSALIGAKLLMVAADAGYYLENPSSLFSLSFWRAGGVFYGGLIGALIGSYLYLRRDRRIPYAAMADAAAPAIALGQGIGRLGCFAAGCDYGTPANVPWAVTFTSQYAHEKFGVPINIALHPAQLYESLGAFLLFLLLLVVHRRRQFQGQVMCLYLMGYGIVRFTVEFFRGDLDRGFLWGEQLSISQAISLSFIVLSLVAYRRLSAKARN